MNMLNKMTAVLGTTLILVASVDSPAIARTHVSHSNIIRPAAITKKMRQQVQRASVQLGPLFSKTENGKSELRSIGWGSGTLLSQDGLILTNYHVADVSELVDQTKQDKSIKIYEGKLVVYLTKRSDQPPVASFIASVVVAKPELDLALIRISSDLSGEPIDASALNLPFIEMGDSDGLEVGDTLNIFGYPSIGGDTITFTSGPVSGFVNEDGMDRAWIKTSATISGGNSGGTGVDEEGLLVGVPTRAWGGGKSSVDCRRTADTNGDGEINEQDTCVPIGGYINALRPVNLAKPLIEEALNGAVASNAEPPPSNEAPNQEPSHTEEPATAAAGDVQISGRIVDAGTGKPIANALFLVLKTGIKWADFDQNDSSQLLDAVRTDRKGNFILNVQLARNTPYSVGFTAQGYNPVTEDDVVIGDDSPDAVNITLKLERK